MLDAAGNFDSDPGVEEALALGAAGNFDSGPGVEARTGCAAQWERLAPAPASLVVVAVGHLAAWAAAAVLAWYLSKNSKLILTKKCSPGDRSSSPLPPRY